MARRKRDRKTRSAAKQPAPPPDASSQGARSGDDSRPDRWRPWLLGGLCALLVVRPLFPSESAALQGDGLMVVMLWIALAAVWLLGVIGRRQFRLRFGWTDAAVLLLVALHTIAAVWATTRGSPRPAVNMLWEWIALGLCFFLARQCIVSDREARAVVAVMVGLAVALAAYGLYQYFDETPAKWAEYERDPDAMLSSNGLWYEPGSRERQLFENRLYSSEPYATFALANSLAGYLAPWLVVTVGIGVAAGLSRKQWRTWLAVLACAVPVAACLILTKSRSAYVATAFGLLLAGWFCRKEKTRIDWRLPAAVAGLGAVLIAAVLVAGGLDVKVLSEASKSLGYRVQYWRSTLGMIADHPIAGCGPGNFQDAYTRYMLPEASEEIADPHNFLLEVWATAGTPAAIALLSVLGCFAYAVLAHPRQLSGGVRKSGPAAESGQPNPIPYVFGGAACGFLLSLPVGLISSAPPSVGARVFAVVFALACVSVCVRPRPVLVVLTSIAALFWLLHLLLALISLTGLTADAGLAETSLMLRRIGLLTLDLAVCVLIFAFSRRWVEDGALPPALPAIGVVVLLVNLLAAGAMGFPGVAGTFWLLLALGLSRTEASRTHALPRSAGLAALGLMMALAWTCSASAFHPVLRCQAAMRLAQQDPGRADQHLKDAAVADPLAVQPWTELALRAFDRWLKQPTRAAFDDFETCVKTALELAPDSAATWRMCGDRYLQAFLATGRTDPDMLNKAMSAYLRAVDLYPNSPVIRASLASALWAAGDENGFREHAATALSLDKRTLHADKKLDERVRDELRRSLSRSSSRKN